jgi:hypothetical protein
LPTSPGRWRMAPSPAGILKLGYGRMLLNSAGLILAFLAIELLLVALDRLIKQHQDKASS